MSVKFGSLQNGDRFYWFEVEYIKIDECMARSVKTGKKVEFHSSVTVYVN